MGRALDFATTWVAIEQGRAVEAKPVAAGVLQIFGQHAGLIFYEALITTPVIFLGCHLVKRIVRPQYAGHSEWQVYLLVGIISLIVAVHNAGFLL